MKAQGFKKYILVANNALQRALVFRFSVYSYRVGNLAELLSQIIIWSVIFQKENIISGYTYDEMVTYILVGWLFTFLTGAYGLERNIANEIEQGNISNFLVKPIEYLKYNTAFAIGRVYLSLVAAVVVQLILIFFFHKHILFYINFFNIFILFGMLIVSFFINIFRAVLTGYIAFWTNDTTGFESTLNILAKFMSGAYFPLSLLPAAFVNISLFFPFIYTFFIPTQLYLGKITTWQGLKGLIIEIVWLFLLYGIIKVVWKRGIKRYEGVGM